MASSAQPRGRWAEVWHLGAAAPEYWNLDDMEGDLQRRGVSRTVTEAVGPLQRQRRRALVLPTCPRLLNSCLQVPRPACPSKAATSAAVNVRVSLHELAHARTSSMATVHRTIELIYRGYIKVAGMLGAVVLSARSS